MAELSTNQKDIIRETWNIIVQEKEIVGGYFFKLLFDKFPDYLVFFKSQLDALGGGGPEVLLKNKNFAEEHILGKVIKALDTVVKNIDDTALLESMLNKLGQFHTKKNVKQHHLENAKGLLCIAVKNHLESKQKWNKDVEEAWTKCLDIIFSLIINGL